MKAFVRYVRICWCICNFKSCYFYCPML